MESTATSGLRNGNVLEIRDACRVCMQKGEDMTNIFDTDNIIDMVLFCTGIQFTNQGGLPLEMCGSCLNDLNIAHKFKQLCISSNESYHSLLTTKIKAEASGDDDYDEPFIEDDNCFILKHEDTEQVADFDVQIKAEFAESDTKSEDKAKKRGPYKKKAKIKCSKGKKTDGTTKKGRRGPYKKREGNKDVQTKLGCKKHLCKPCGLKFCSAAMVSLHRRTVHKGDNKEGKEPSWICEICGQQFVHRGSLVTHSRSHFPPAFACAACDYRAASKQDLAKHLLIHAGEKRHQCDKCTARFYTSSNLLSHVRRNHDRLKNYHCELCGRGFYDRTKYNRHQDTHYSIKRFECEFCQSAFTRRCYWKKHLNKQHNVVVPPQRPGRQRKNLIVDVPTTEYVKPELIKMDPTPAPT